MTARFAAQVAPSLDRDIAIEWDTSHIAGEIEGQAIVHFSDASLSPVILPATQMEITPYNQKNKPDEAPRWGTIECGTNRGAEYHVAH